jgi:hypothetical protein
MRTFVICTLHLTPLVIKSSKMKWVKHAAHMGRFKKKHIFVRRHEGKRPRQEVNSELYLTTIGNEVYAWVPWAQDKVQWLTVVKTVV